MGRTRYSRWSVGSLLSAAAAGLAAFAITWVLLAPAVVERPSPLARIRRQAGADDRLEQLVTEVLRPENIRRLVDNVGLPQAGGVLVKGDFAEWARGNLRVEIGEPDRVGNQSINVRWVGDPAAACAVRLVNLLARQLADRPSSADRQANERELKQAQSEAIAAERALVQARRQFDEALAAASPHSQSTSVPRPAPIPRPASAAESSEHAAWFQARQQLDELERRREVMAERLMPEHPEMKALDDKIDVLRSGLSNQPTPAPAVPNDEAETAVAGVAPAGSAPSLDLGLVERLGQNVLAAQERFRAALATERACWQRLAQEPVATFAEVEPAAETPQIIGHPRRWQRWLVSFIAAIGFDGLTLALCRGRRQTFNSVEEVRACTRLPVVVVDRVMLN